MRVLFDQKTPAPLRKHLATHQVSTAFELNWSALQNGELIAQMGRPGLVTSARAASTAASRRAVSHSGNPPGHEAAPDGSTGTRKIRRSMRGGRSRLLF